MNSEDPLIKGLISEVGSIYKVINEGSDLACVLITTSFLDESLATLLRQFLVKSKTAKNLLESRGTLATYASRVDMCYCLGVISKGLYQNLRIIGEIRNSFAHSHIKKSFDDNDVGRLCDQLTFPSVAQAIYVGSDTEVSDSREPFSRFRGVRSRFSIITVLMANRLLLVGLSIERQARETKGW